MARVPPPSASVAHAQDGDKLHAPAAGRNVESLRALLCDHAPASGSALEIASGTGQHVTDFARAFPDLIWQPSDVEDTRLRSIDAYREEAGLSNILPAIALDATKPDWHMALPTKDLILLVNLLHLISDPEAQTLVAEAALTLAPGGTLILYGPFKRNGALTSAGDESFDAKLRAADPAIGYKDDLDIVGWLGKSDLTDVSVIQMPANNLAFIARKGRP